MDVPIHVPNSVEFHTLIEELKNQTSVVAQRFEERMVAQLKVMVGQIKIMAKKTKTKANQA